MTSRSAGDGKVRKEVKQVLKVLILGDAAVGKSCIMSRFINNQFEENSFHTIGVEFLNKEFSLNDKTYTLQIWDTAGQERFKSLRTPFYRGTDICLLVFAIDDKQSFNNLSIWRQEFLHYADIQDPNTFPFIVIGNKVDLASRQISVEESHQWCYYHGSLPFFETSAKEDINIVDVFREAVGQWAKHESAIESKMIANGNILYLTQPNQDKKHSCC